MPMKPHRSGGGSCRNSISEDEAKHFKPMQNISLQPPTTPITCIDTATHRRRRQDEIEMEGQQGAIVALKRQRTSSTASSRAPILNQDTSCGGWTSIFLDQLSLNPQIGQLVATAGGLVTYCKFTAHSYQAMCSKESDEYDLSLFCAYDVHLTLILYTYHMFYTYIANEAFYDITHSSSSKNKLPNSPLTIFELIESNSLPSLYGMLALALHNISIMHEDSSSLPMMEDEEDTSSLKEERDEQTADAAQHLSITLPCKSFGDDDNSQYNITVRITMSV